MSFALFVVFWAPADFKDHTFCFKVMCFVCLIPSTLLLCNYFLLIEAFPAGGRRGLLKLRKLIRLRYIAAFTRSQPPHSPDLSSQCYKISKQ